MPQFSFIKSKFKSNFACGNWWWQFACWAELTSDSNSKLHYVVIIKSIQEDELFKISFGLFMTWLKPKLKVK